MLIQAATGDSLRPDAQSARGSCRRAMASTSRLELYPVETHVFHYFWSFLPEAADALEGGRPLGP